MTKSFHFNHYTHYACFIYRCGHHCARAFLSASGWLLLRNCCPTLTEQRIFNPLPIWFFKKLERLTIPPVSLFYLKIF